MIFKIRKEFYQKCTREGILTETGKILGKSNTLIFIIFSFITVFEILFFVTFKINFFEMNIQKNLALIVLFYLYTLVITCVIMTLVLFYSNKFYISKLKNKYSDYIDFSNLNFDKPEGYLKKYLTPYYHNNEYRQVVKKILTHNQRVFEENFKLQNLQIVEEIIKINNEDINKIKEKTQNTSNKVIYGFVGGILVNKVFDFFDGMIFGVDKDKIEIENLLLYIGTIIIVVLVPVLIIANVYKVLSKYMNNHWFKEIRVLEEFNSYLIDKKLSMLKD